MHHGLRGDGRPCLKICPGAKVIRCKGVRSNVPTVGYKKNQRSEAKNEQRS